ncbi:sodium/proline symporter PutP [Microbacterium indicum]|uniref:sodium/proline symporter PutP n=1 Tax=Microbacterium indicum TaxID=358100 RepID=UPI0003F787EC|nr:sodium/proline symporter PutP [Microbacterium indicum]
MPATTVYLIALGVYLVAMIAIGYYGFRRTKNHDDYMLGGRDLPPAVAALSAGASDMSGWLMMGLPGAIYLSGLIEAWMAIGLTIGAYLNWRLVAPRLRAYTEVANDSVTVPIFLENRTHDRTHLLRIVAGVVILVFFTLYVSSGMVAGGKFFVSSFGGDYLTGMLVIGGVTVLYSLFGGFLGASYTDFVQGVLMMLALIGVPILAFIAVLNAGDSATAAFESHMTPGQLSFFGDDFSFSTVIVIVSALAWGLGYFGQPHIIVRFMALRNAREAKTARRIGMGWMVLSLLGTIVSGFLGIAYLSLNGIELDDVTAETVVLEMAQLLFHPFIAGLVLAAVVAAIMSTISSQLIVSSSALIDDIGIVIFKKKPSPKAGVWLGRLGVLVISVVAILLSLDQNSSILELVSFAWAGFGAGFGPLILLSLFWRRLTNWGAIAGMVLGSATVFIWPIFGTGLYELLPGFVIGLVAAVVVSLATHRPDTVDDREIQDEFTRTGAIVLEGIHGEDASAS